MIPACYWVWTRTAHRLSQGGGRGLWVPCGRRGVKADLGAEPFARGGLGLGAILRAEIGKGLVEHGDRPSGCFRDKVPFQALDLVDRRAESVHQHPGEAVLRDRAVLPRRLAQQRHRGGFVLRRAGAVEERDGVFDLGIDIVGQRRRLQQPHRLFDVLLDAGALLVEGRQRVLRFRHCRRRRRSEAIPPRA